MADEKSGVVGPSAMLPITVGDFERELAKARAEVLAACEPLFREVRDLIKGLRRSPDFDNHAIIHGWEALIDAAKKPAGAALEELLRKEREKYAAALSDLVAALDRVHADPQYQSVWTLSTLHGGNYTGPTYEKELEKARAIKGKG